MLLKVLTVLVGSLVETAANIIDEEGIIVGRCWGVATVDGLDVVETVVDIWN